ncbi:MAG: O-antigen ligase family protein [Bacteroidetes bacterium]|nr:O-antigen ligase family protein [Bacteroidota bacterium]
MLNSLISNRQPHIVILSIIILLPFGGIVVSMFGQTPTIYFSQMVAIIVAISVVIRISLRKVNNNYFGKEEFHREKVVLGKLVLIFICLSLPSLILTSEFTRSIYILSDRILVLLVFLAILHYGSEPKHRYWLLWSVAASGTSVACMYLFSGMQVYETTNIELLSYGFGAKSPLVKAGMVGLSNTVASILDFTIVISIALFLLEGISFKQKMIVFTLITIQVITLISTVSRAGIATLILLLFILILFIYKSRFSKKVLLLIIIVAVTFSLYFITITYLPGITGRLYATTVLGGVVESDISHRLTLFNYSLQDFLDNPIFGIGIGNVWHSDRPVHFGGLTHNLYIQTLAEEGIFVFLSLCCLLFIMLRRFIKLNRLYPSLSQSFVLIAFCVPLINSLVSPDFWTPQFTYSFWISMAILICGPVPHYGYFSRSGRKSH